VSVRNRGTVSTIHPAGWRIFELAGEKLGSSFHTPRNL